MSNPIPMPTGSFSRMVAQVVTLIAPQTTRRAPYFEAHLRADIAMNQTTARNAKTESITDQTEFVPLTTPESRHHI